MIIRRWTHGRGSAHKTVSLMISEWKLADVEITDLYVHPSCRGRGWARMLMWQAIDHCHTWELRVCLRVRPHGKKSPPLTALAGFYRELGFVESKGPTDEMWMVLRRWAPPLTRGEADRKA